MIFLLHNWTSALIFYYIYNIQRQQKIEQGIYCILYWTNLQICKFGIMCKNDAFVVKIANMHLTKTFWPFSPLPKGCQLLPPCHQYKLENHKIRRQQNLYINISQYRKSVKCKTLSAGWPWVKRRGRRWPRKNTGIPFENFSSLLLYIVSNSNTNTQTNTLKSSMRIDTFEWFT